MAAYQGVDLEFPSGRLQPGEEAGWGCRFHPETGVGEDREQQPRRHARGGARRRVVVHQQGRAARPTHVEGPKLDRRWIGRQPQRRSLAGVEADRKSVV